MSGNRWSDGQERNPVFPYVYTGDLRLIDDGEVLPALYFGTVSVCAFDWCDAMDKLEKHFDLIHGEIHCESRTKKLVHVISIREGLAFYPIT